MYVYWAMIVGQEGVNSLTLPITGEMVPVCKIGWFHGVRCTITTTLTSIIILSYNVITHVRQLELYMSNVMSWKDFY